MSDPFASMAPNDAAVALRTLPRRFRDAARTAAATDLDGPPDDATIDDVAARVGPDGHSASDLVAAAAERLDALHVTLARALVSQAAIVSPALLDAEPHVAHHPAASRFSAAVERLGDACDGLAELVEGADPNRWDARVSVEGGGSTSPLQVLQRGVAAVVSCERALSPLLRAVRGR